MTDAGRTYWQLVKAGLCPGCKGTPAPGRRRCTPCQRKCVPQTPEARALKRKLGTDRKRQQWQERVALGQCGRCGDPVRDTNPKTGRKYVDCVACVGHEAKYRRKRKEVKRVNKCGRCGEVGHLRPTCKRIHLARFDAPVPYAPLDVVEFATARREA